VPNPKLARIVQRRGPALTQPERAVDWGHAETLAFATLLTEGIPVRLTGQDSQRGTFNQRQAVLHSQEKLATYTPLQHLAGAQASFSIYNSPLSEIGVLGFEYGYSVHAPDGLVLWEAQYGDFANVAQVIIDQFISSGRAKWRQDSALVLLLPHGYEGNGPEHSSARLERYLQMAAEDNWQIANCTTSAQYFHLLRHQAYSLKKHPRPLVVMSPKSLLRNSLAASNMQDLTQDSFHPVLDDQMARQKPEQVRRVVLCTGKIAIDLQANQQKKRNEEVAIARVEMLYPLPVEEIKKVLAGYPRVREIVWVQEEPRNMGAWSYMFPRLRRLLDDTMKLDVISRPERSSPATGFWDIYTAEQEELIARATTVSLPSERKQR
jgi:2-oxoglutarate dehydrogenase E1 component